MLERLQALRNRHAAEDANYDQIATDTTKIIIGDIEAALCQSDEVRFTPKGHYIVVGLTVAGRQRLQESISNLIRGRLGSARCDGELSAIRDRMGMAP